MKSKCSEWTQGSTNVRPEPWYWEEQARSGTPEENTKSPAERTGISMESKAKAQKFEKDILIQY